MGQLRMFDEGSEVEPEQLSLDRARQMAYFLSAGTNPFARMEECRVVAQNGQVRWEVVVLEVDVELSQHPVHDVRYNERLAVRFWADDGLLPEVLALREDFPMVAHLNLRPPDSPRSLCLYDRPFDEVMLDWTIPTFVERIRFWLAKTAQGQLHADDQPLEPLLFDPVEDLIIPEEIFERTPETVPSWFSVELIPNHYGTNTAVVQLAPRDNSPDATKCVGYLVPCPPTMHGTIHHMPRTLEELHDFVAALGVSLVGKLREALKSWINGGTSEVYELVGARLILIFRFPKTRQPNGRVESVEFRAFAMATTIGDVGADIGVWDLVEGKPGLLIQADETKHGTDTPLIPLNPRPSFSRSLAARVNGADHSSEIKIAAIGIGALGSQVVSNLVRGGFGQWTLIDGDLVLPHNLGRHALYGFSLGLPKSSTLAHILNGTVDGEPIARGIVANVMRPGKDAEDIQSALSEAKVILDISASIPVARHLCHDIDAQGRRVSLFLNPSGTALTLLAEDSARQVPLDALEMQSYREICTLPELAGFFSTNERLRIGQSCRDLSVSIPQDLVALHAAIASHALKQVVLSDRPLITIWQVDQENYTVKTLASDPSEVYVEKAAGWIVYTDSKLRQKLEALREEKLPKETGGVLIGSYDMQRKIIYVVETIPSPDDSEEWTTGFIRGTKNLLPAVEEISRATSGMLRYVGEWHSHPDGAAVRPSGYDQQQMNWLGDIMDGEGRPGVVAIVGEDHKAKFYVGGDLAKASKETAVH